MTPVVFDTVTKRYGSVVALDAVDLRIPVGGIHALAGANGSGKTTMLRLIAGLTDPTSGSVTRPATHIGYAFQDPNVYPALSVRENLAVFGDLHDTSPPWTDRLLDVFRLERVADRPATTLSAGYRKKLDLALALVGEPSLLLLDEPLADVDDLTARNFVEFLTAYATDDRLVVLATHNLAAFADAIDRLTVVHDGSIVPTPTDADDVVAVYEEVINDRSLDPV
ncbi:MAG: ABC transporter ATP-binding protein [Halobacteriaceae archaeon]